MRFAILALLLITALLPSAAKADDEFYFKPTVGADYQFTHVKYEDDGDDFVDDNLNGVNVHIGARVHRNLGFELGYLTTRKESKHNSTFDVDTDVKLKGFNLDALGYLPVNDKVDLIGTVGVSRLNVELDASGPGGVASFDDTETKGRIGAGAQVWLTPNSNLRGIVRYQGADFDDSVKYAIVGNIGLNYQF